MVAWSLMASSKLSRSVLLILAIAFTTTMHELFHLVVGRAFGIPTRFLSLTSVGILKTDTTVYPPLALAAMNSVAPILSFFLFGVLPFCLLRRKRFGEPWFSLLGWSAIFNLPYFGLQLMLAVNKATVTGSGSDTAAVMESFAVGKGVRSILGSLGYLVFLVALYRLGRVLFIRTDHLEKDGAGSVTNGRKITAAGTLVLGFLLVVLGDAILLAGNQKPGMSFVALGGFGSIALAAMIAISYRNPVFQSFKEQWLLPGIFGMAALAAFGILKQNDYADFWLIMLPSTLAIGAVMTNQILG